MLWETEVSLPREEESTVGVQLGPWLGWEESIASSDSSLAPAFRPRGKASEKGNRQKPPKHHLNHHEATLSLQLVWRTAQVDIPWKETICLEMGYIIAYIPWNLVMRTIMWLHQLQ